MTVIYIILPLAVVGFLIFSFIFLLNKLFTFLEKKYPDKIGRIPSEKLMQEESMFDDDWNDTSRPSHPANPAWDD